MLKCIYSNLRMQVCNYFNMHNTSVNMLHLDRFGQATYLDTLAHQFKGAVVGIMFSLLVKISCVIIQFMSHCAFGKCPHAEFHSHNLDNNTCCPHPSSKDLRCWTPTLRTTGRCDLMQTPVPKQATVHRPDQEIANTTGIKLAHLVW
jgi:hypothetical protein